MNSEKGTHIFETEKQNFPTANAIIGELLSCGACYDSANTETKHMMLSRLIGREEVGSEYRIQIHFKVAFEQFTSKQL